MALNIFSIPPMSAETEHVFSGTQHTISWDRAQLGGCIVQIMEYLKSWICSGLSHSTFKTATEVEEVAQAVKKQYDMEEPQQQHDQLNI